MSDRTIRNLKLAVTAGVTAGMFFAFSAQVDAQTKTLRVANWLPSVHHMTRTLNLWGESIADASGDSLKFEVMKTPLAKPPGQYDLVKKNVVDFAYSVAAYSPKRFKLFRAVEMPFLVPNAETGSAAAWAWYEKHKFAGKEFSDSKLVGLFVHSPFLYHSRKKLTSLGDLKGLKIRAGGYGIPILKKLGAVPLFLNPVSTAEAMQRGTIDGSQFPWESLLGLRLIKFSKYHLVFPKGLYTTAFWLSMSKKSWDGLTAAQKNAMNKAAGLAGSRLIGKRWDSVEAAGKNAAVKAGNTITVLSDAETASLKKTIAFVEEGWVADANKAGHDGKALLADLRATIANFK